jgi:hypothetical protein
MSPTRKLAARGFELLRVSIWAAKAFAELACLAPEVAVARDLLLGAGKARIDPGNDHLALKLEEDAEHAKHGAAGRRVGID